MSKDYLRLYIRDCRVNLRIGLYESELQQQQPVLINLECEAKVPLRYDDMHDKRLTHVIDYASFYHFIQHDLPLMGHIYFLESAAEQIITFCLQDERIQSVRVRIEKTAIFPDAAGAGVELYRVRP